MAAIFTCELQMTDRHTLYLAKNIASYQVFTSIVLKINHLRNIKGTVRYKFIF